MQPIRNQGAMGFDERVGAPEGRWIGNLAEGRAAQVVTRHPHVLVGARQDHYMQDVLRVIDADVDHPLRPILDPETAGTSQLRFIKPPYKKIGSELTDWQDFPADMEPAHVLSKKLGDADVLVLDTRFNNQLQSNTIESRGIGFGARLDDIVVVGGIPITRTALWDLFNDGKVRLTKEQMLSVPSLRL